MASTIVTDLSTILGKLTPGQLRGLGNQLTSSGQMQALTVLDEMEMSDAAALSGQLGAIQGLPPAVMTFVSQAIKAAAKTPPDQASFDNAITNAKVQLQQAATSTDILGGLF